MRREARSDWGFSVVCFNDNPHQFLFVGTQACNRKLGQGRQYQGGGVLQVLLWWVSAAYCVICIEWIPVSSQRCFFLRPSAGQARDKDDSPQTHGEL